MIQNHQPNKKGRGFFLSRTCAICAITHQIRQLMNGKCAMCAISKIIGK